MSAASSAAGIIVPSFVHRLPSYHGSLLHASKFDTLELMREYEPSFEGVKNKKLIWKMIKERNEKETSSAAASSSSASSAASSSSSSSKTNKPKQLRYARYNSETMSIPITNLSKSTMEFEIIRGVYGYTSQNDPSHCEWYVNFADKHLFGFYGTDLFAQDEWQCQEHPCIISMREYLSHASEKDPSSKPLTVTKNLPTPCLIMNARREVEIDAVGGEIYGNNFAIASKSVIQASTKLLEPPTLSNILAMEALKHGRGRYTTNQIFMTLQTAITGFMATKLESFQEYSETKCYIKSPKIVVHTGNWGCGAFGGNVELMCLLQLLSGHIARVDKLIYHALSEKDQILIQKAVKECEKIVNVMKEKEQKDGSAFGLEELAALIAANGYAWGFSNGT